MDQPKTTKEKTKPKCDREKIDHFAKIASSSLSSLSHSLTSERIRHSDFGRKKKTIKIDLKSMISSISAFFFRVAILDDLKTKRFKSSRATTFLFVYSFDVAFRQHFEAEISTQLSLP